MPTQLSADEVIVGDIKILTGGQIQKAIIGSLARTDTSAKTLGELPAGATIMGVTVASAGASNAGTSASISVGAAGGTGTEYLSSCDVKGNGTGQYTPVNGKLGSVGSSPVTVTGTYTETGTASSAGGPFTVVIEFLTPTS